MNYEMFLFCNESKHFLAVKTNFLLEKNKKNVLNYKINCLKHFNLMFVFRKSYALNAKSKAFCKSSIKTFGFSKPI